MTAAPKGFLAHLVLDRAAEDTWHGRAGGERVPRGLLAAQAMIASGATTDTNWRWVHAVTATYLEMGDSRQPIEYRVENLLDTDHSATRLVHARQGGNRLAAVTVSFQAPRRDIGSSHQTAVWDEDLPDPHALRCEPRGHHEAPIDVRYVDRAPDAPPATSDATNRMWVRLTEEVPDRLLPHAAALAYAADSLLPESVTQPAGVVRRDRETGRPLRMQPLDLVMRFHRGFRADDWVLLEQCSPTMSDHRALSTGAFYSSLGRLIATVSQESVLLPAVED